MVDPGVYAPALLLCVLAVDTKQDKWTGLMKKKFISWYDNCDDIDRKRVLLEDICLMVALPESVRINCYMREKVGTKVVNFHGVNLEFSGV